MKYQIVINDIPQPMLEVSGSHQDDAVIAVKRANAEDAGRFSPAVVKMWVPKLVEAGYGPYTYRVKYYHKRLLAFGKNPASDHAWEMMHDGDPLGGLLWTRNKLEAIR